MALISSPSRSTSRAAPACLGEQLARARPPALSRASCALRADVGPQRRRPRRMHSARGRRGLVVGVGAHPDRASSSAACHAQRGGALGFGDALARAQLGRRSQLLGRALGGGDDLTPRAARRDVDLGARRRRLDGSAGSWLIVRSDGKPSDHAPEGGKNHDHGRRRRGVRHPCAVPPVAKVEPLTTARALRGPFDYLRPDGVGVGSVLVVPFGHRDILGVVVELAEESELADDRLVAPRRSSTTPCPPSSSSSRCWMAARVLLDAGPRAGARLAAAGRAGEARLVGATPRAERAAAGRPARPTRQQRAAGELPRAAAGDATCRRCAAWRTAGSSR